MREITPPRSFTWQIAMACLMAIILVGSGVYLVYSTINWEMSDVSAQARLMAMSLSSRIEDTFERFKIDMKYSASQLPFLSLTGETAPQGAQIAPIHRFYSLYQNLISEIRVVGVDGMGRSIVRGKDNYFITSPLRKFPPQSSAADAPLSISLPLNDGEGAARGEVTAVIDFNSFVRQEFDAVASFNPSAILWLIDSRGDVLAASRGANPSVAPPRLDTSAVKDVLIDVKNGFEGVVRHHALVPEDTELMSAYYPLSIGTEPLGIMASYDLRILDPLKNSVMIVSLVFTLTLCVAVYVFMLIARQKRAAQESLRRSEERWSFAIDGSGDGLWDWNTTTNEVFFSRRWKEMLGFSEEEIGSTSMEWEFRIHPDDKEAVFKELRRHFEGDTAVYQSEHRILCKDGTYKWILDRGMIVNRAPDGSFTRMIGTHTDITDRRKASEEIQRLTERLDIALNASGIGIWDLDILADRLEWDDRMHQLYGTAKDNFDNSLQAWFARIQPEDSDRASMQVCNAIDTRGEYSSDFRVLCPDGTTRHLKACGRVFRGSDGAPCRMIGVCYDITELKKNELQLRRHAETESIIAHISTYFINASSTSIDQSISWHLGIVGKNEGVARVSLHLFEWSRMLIRKAAEWNDAGVSPAPEETPIESLPWLVARLKNFETITIDSVKDLPASASLECNFFRSRGTISALVIPLVWEGSLDGFLSLESEGDRLAQFHLDSAPLRLFADILINALKRRESQDILLHNQNAIKEMNDTLEQKVEERTRLLEKAQSQLFLQEKLASIGQLAAGMAHEINNPVSFVSTNFATMRDDVETFREILGLHRGIIGEIPPGVCAEEIQNLHRREEELGLEYILSDIDKLFDESKDGIRRVAAIVSSMRDFSRVDTSGAFINFDINHGLHDTLVIARNAYKYNADVTTDFGQLPEILCVPGQINQVFLNIIVNAAQAIASANNGVKGNISVRTWLDNETVRCEISDDGPGIPADIRSRVFDPFFTTKAPGQGTGLGLSISYDIIVNKHGGTLAVESEPGKGTRFLIGLPVQRGHSQTIQEES